MKSAPSLILFVFAVVFLLSISEANAESLSILTGIENKFKEASAEWVKEIESAALWLFWTLACISMVWTFGMQALKRAEIGDFFAEFVRFLLFTGFYLWLLKNGPEYGKTIIDSLQQLGNKAGGVSASSSEIVDLGIEILVRAVEDFKFSKLGTSLASFFVSIIALIILAVIAVNKMLLIISSWILLYAGVFILGFGGSKWTSEMALNYYRTILGIAIQIFAMTLLLSIGVKFITSFAADLKNNGVTIEQLATILVACIALLMLTTKVPPMLAGLVPGGSGASGIGGFSAGAAAMGVASMAAGSVGGTISAAGGALGLGRAVKAAHDAPGSTLGNLMKGAAALGGDAIGKTTGGKMAEAIKANAAKAAAAGDSGSLGAGKGKPPDPPIADKPYQNSIPGQEGGS